MTKNQVQELRRVTIQVHGLILINMANDNPIAVDDVEQILKAAKPLERLLKKYGDPPILVEEVFSKRKIVDERDEVETDV